MVIKKKLGLYGKPLPCLPLVELDEEGKVKEEKL